MRKTVVVPVGRLIHSKMYIAPPSSWRTMRQADDDNSGKVDPAR
jgi:hypothetical protein